MTPSAPTLPPASDAARAAIRALRRDEVVPPPGWHPVGHPDLALWLGPGLAVATRSSGGRWRIVEPPEASRLLVAHALDVAPDLRSAVTSLADPVPLGTPIAEAVAAIAEVLPGSTVVPLPDASATLFVRPGEAVLQIVGGKYGELEWMSWLVGDDALAAHVAAADHLPSTRLPDRVVVAALPPERTTRRHAIAIAGLALLAGPALAAPLMLVDAVLALIGVVAIWTVTIAGAPALLRWLGRRGARELIRLDAWRMWLPNRLSPIPLDRSATTVELRRRDAFGSATTGFAGRAPSVRNPAMTYLVVRSPHGEVTIGCTGTLAHDRPVPLVEPGWSVDRFVEVSMADLRRLVEAIGRDSR